MNIRFRLLFTSIMFLSATSCTKKSESISTLKNAADDRYYDAARVYQDAADDLNRSADSLDSAAFGADAARLKVESTTASVRSFIQGAESDIRTADAERSKAEVDEARYVGDEIASNVQAESYIKRTESLMKELREITQQVYILENKTAIKQEQKSGIANFAKAIQNFSVMSDNFTANASEMQNLAQTAEQQHADWMKQFEALSLQMKPVFSSIIDLDSYRNTLASINDFKSKIPSMGQLRGIERRYADAREELVVSAQKLREIAYQLSSSKEFAIYLNFYPDSKISSQMDEIEKFSRDIVSVSREQARFHDARNERRQYLSLMVPSAWEKLAKVNLQLNNEKIGIDLINQVQTVMGSQYVYNAFLKKLNDQSIAYYSLQRTLFAPRRASLIVADTLDYLGKLETPDRMNALSPEMRSQLQAEIKDAKKLWLSNQTETVASLNPQKLPTILKEWQRQAKLIGARLKPTVPQSCRRSVTQIGEATVADKATEEAFYLLKTGC